jgi:hypothetical protein
LPANATAGSVVTGTVSYTNNGTSTAANVTGSVVVGTAGGTITTSNTGNTSGISLTPWAIDHPDLHLHGAGEQRDGHQHGDDHHRRQHPDQQRQHHAA